MRPLEQVVERMWPGTLIIPFMDTGASDSIYTTAAGIPSYGIHGLGIDQGNIRAHGKDERRRAKRRTGTANPRSSHNEGKLPPAHATLKAKPSSAQRRGTQVVWGAGEPQFAGVLSSPSPSANLAG